MQRALSGKMHLSIKHSATRQLLAIQRATVALGKLGEWHTNLHNNTSFLTRSGFEKSSRHPGACLKTAGHRVILRMEKIGTLTSSSTELNVFDEVACDPR